MQLRGVFVSIASKQFDVAAARGIQLCLIQLAREARDLGLKFAAAHMDVAALEIADSVGDVTSDLNAQLSVANDTGLASSKRGQA